MVILRDLVIVSGALVYNFRIERLEAEPSMVSKLNTFTQIMLVLAVLFSQSVTALPYLWMDVLLYCVFVTTLWSGLDYVWRWSRRAWRKGAH